MLWGNTLRGFYEIKDNSIFMTNSFVQIGKQLLNNADLIEAQFESLIIITMTDHMSKLGLTAIVMFSKQITQDYFKTKWEL